MALGRVVPRRRAIARLPAAAIGQGVEVWNVPESEPSKGRNYMTE